MPEPFICEGFRTPIGRYAGALSSIRTDDLAAEPLLALHRRFPTADWASIDEIILGCVNQAGEDNRNVARMALLIARLPHTIPAATVNRLCASGLEAVAQAARAIRTGEISLGLAGGVESMSRSPFVIPKATTPFSRNAEMHDTTLGWRFINPIIQSRFGTESMAETAENVAALHNVSRADQDLFALRSQHRAGLAQQAGIFAEEICSVTIPAAKGSFTFVDTDEHPRPSTTLEALTKLNTPFRQPGTVTAGNASGINDGACTLFVASEAAAAKFGLTPIARFVSAATAGVEPGLMGIGPIPAIEKLLAHNHLTINQIDLIELNEAFAAQALAVTRHFGLPDDAPHVNPNGGAIALGHPLGMSGARLALTAALQLRRTSQRYAIATMCIGVGQGMAALLERI